MAVSHQWFIQWSSPPTVFADINDQFNSVNNWNNAKPDWAWEVTLGNSDKRYRFPDYTQHVDKSRYGFPEYTQHVDKSRYGFAKQSSSKQNGESFLVVHLDHHTIVPL